MFNYAMFLFLFVAATLRASDDAPIGVSKKLAIAHVWVGNGTGHVTLKLSPVLKDVDLLSGQGARLKLAVADDLKFWSKYQEFHHIQLNRGSDKISISNDSVVLRLSDLTVACIKELKEKNKRARAIHLVAPLLDDEVVEEDRAVQHALSSSCEPEPQSPMRDAIKRFFLVEF